ncbi:MAG TPA: T9SS type A sorting domain-containing protein, partial [Chitinophagaceae bacterium]|nr:T9SS type A sorting domain-containing protein [Chitinophagaceae bacterium]
ILPPGAALRIYPNPTTGDIYISGAPAVNIEIYNAIGQKVKATNNTSEISIANLPDGCYLIKLIDGNGRMVYQDRVVKR